MSEPTRTRLVALVSTPDGERRAIHTAGYPLDPAKMLPLADVVLLIAADGTDAMLFRYTAHGEGAGDTWHPTVEHARHQAAEEFGDTLGAWEEVGADVADPHVYAVRYAHDRLNSRGDW